MNATRRDGTGEFYDTLAEYYHLMFADWDEAIGRQAGILGPLLERYAGSRKLSVLDCACGIGTQSLGLAKRGYTVVGSDLSEQAVARARREAAARGLRAAFHVADMRELAGVPDGAFDAVIAADNAIPHLLEEGDRDRAMAAMARTLRAGGVLLATIRDYDMLIQTRPTMQAPLFFGAEGDRRIFHQVWDWDGSEYELHQYLTFETRDGWVAKHFVSRYRALLRAELDGSLRKAGFRAIEWLSAEASGFYQPIVIARREPTA